MSQQRERFAGPNGDIPRPPYEDIPPALPREQGIRIAVLSRGAITPLGNDACSTWEGFVDGRNGITEHRYPPYTEPTLDSEGKEVEPQIRATTAGTIKGFDPTALLITPGVLPHKEVKFKMGDYAMYGVAASHEALLKVTTGDGRSLIIPRENQVGFNKGRKWILNSDVVNPLHFIVAAASGFGGGDEAADVKDKLKEGVIPSGDNMMRSLLDRAASTITQAYGFNGGAEGYVAACASFGKALIAAINKISLGRAEMGLVVGTEGVLWKPHASAMFDSFGALDQGKDPSKVSRSLHKERFGFTIAEGALAFVIADYDFAKRNGFEILYEIVGYGETSGGGENVAPNGSAQEQAMRMARRQAERQGPIRGRVINSGHYTGTPAGDGGEVLRTQNVLEDYQDEADIVATKRRAGHLLGAAGGLSMDVAGQALRTGLVPGTPIDGEIMDEVHGWSVPQETVDRHGEITDALVNQFGFGDANVSLWLRKSN